MAAHWHSRFYPNQFRFGKVITETIIPRGMVAPLWQLSVSSQHMVKSLSLCNLKLCTHIWSTNINFRPPYIGLFGPSWSELLPYGWIAWRGSVGPATYFFCHGRTETWLLKNPLWCSCDARWGTEPPNVHHSDHTSFLFLKVNAI